jgi:hypothetical protein
LVLAIYLGGSPIRLSWGNSPLPVQPQPLQVYPMYPVSPAADYEYPAYPPHLEEERNVKYNTL